MQFPIFPASRDGVARVALRAIRTDKWRMALRPFFDSSANSSFRIDVKFFKTIGVTSDSVIFTVGIDRAYSILFLAEGSFMNLL